MAIKTTKNENIYFVINCLVILIVGFGTFIYSIHPDLTDFRNSIYGLLVNFLFLAGIILYVTLSRKINMPLLGKITVWIYGLLFILSVIFDFGRIEMLFFFIYRLGKLFSLRISAPRIQPTSIELFEGVSLPQSPVLFLSM